MSDNFESLFIQFLKDKPAAMNTLFDDLQRLISLNTGLSKFLTNIDEEEMNEENVRQKIRTIMRVVKSQNSMLIKFITLLIAYTQGKNFENDIAVLLQKFGKGDEALEILLDNKSKGK
jgi:hypothetical protein